MNHEELQDLAALYALGALDGEDLQNFVRHLSTCESCRKLVSEHERVSADLASTLPPGSPRPELRSKILEEVRRSSFRMPRWVGWSLGAAAATLLAILLGAFLYHAREDVSALNSAIAALHRQTDTIVDENHTITQELTARKAELETERKKLKEALDTVLARDQDLEKKKGELSKLAM